MNNKTNQKGFSLIELLVVVIIIGIIAAIAVPSLLSSRRSANEASAVANLRTVNTAQQTYLATVGGTAYQTFAGLSASGTDLLDNSWTGTPTKNNYTYTLTLGGTGNVGFCVTAATGALSSGAYSYAISHEGSIYRVAGTTPPACDAATGAITSGTVVGS